MTLAQNTCRASNMETMLKLATHINLTVMSMSPSKPSLDFFSLSLGFFLFQVFSVAFFFY